MTKQNEPPSPPPNCVGCDADVCTCFRDNPFQGGRKEAHL